MDSILESDPNFSLLLWYFVNLFFLLFLSGPDGLLSSLEKRLISTSLLIIFLSETDIYVLLFFLDKMISNIVIKLMIKKVC